MILTIDTSVAVKWLVDQPGHLAAKSYLSLMNHSGTAPVYGFSSPSLLLLEAHNVLAKLFRQGLVPYGHLMDGPDFLASAVEIHPMNMDFARASSQRSIAARYRLASFSERTAAGILPPFNIYDCAFIEHAALHQQPLLTSDRKQAEIAQAFGVKIEFIASD